MDDSFPIPDRSDVMGKGCIRKLFKNRAVVSVDDDNYTVEILSKDTFDNAATDLKDIFDIGEEVVYKANLRKPPIDNRPKFVASYVRHVKSCYVGEATICNLEKSFGFLSVPPDGRGTMSRRIFFPADAYGDYAAKSSFSQIRNCQTFFRKDDKVSCIAVQTKASKDSNRCDLFCFHFDLILNENYKTRLDKVDQLLIGIVVEILEPDKPQRQPIYRNCRIYVKKVGYLTLFAHVVHRYLTNLADIVSLGERISFKYRAAEPDILKKMKDVELMDKSSQLRLAKWLKDHCLLENNNNKPSAPTYKFNDLNNETASYNDSSFYMPSRSTNCSNSQGDFGSFQDQYREWDDVSHDSVVGNTGSQNAISSHFDSTLSFGVRQPSLKMTGPNYVSQPSVRKMVPPVQNSTKINDGGGFTPRQLVNAITPRNQSVCTQTDNSGDSLLKKIMDDKELFNFIASKRPELIKEYYEPVESAPVRKNNANVPNKRGNCKNFVVRDGNFRE